MTKKQAPLLTVKQARLPVAFLAAFSCLTLPAADRIWLGGEGNFADDFNWNGGLPDPANRPIIDTADANVHINAGDIIAYPGLHLRQGMITMTGGTVTATDGQHIGYAPNQTNTVAINMSGGEWTVVNDTASRARFHFASSGNNTANITLSGSAKIATTKVDGTRYGSVLLGDKNDSTSAGSGNLTMSDSAQVSTGEFFVGWDKGGTSNLIMSDNSRIDADRIGMGRRGATAIAVLNDNAVWNSAADLIVGSNGTASLTVNDNATITGGAGYTLSIGGSFSTDSNQPVATGTFTLNGGSVSATGVYLGKKHNSSLANKGYAFLNGGTLTAQFIRKGNDGNGSGEDSSITFNGGTVVFTAGTNFESELFKGFATADLKIEAGGLTLDIGANNASLSQGLTGGGTLTKRGEGTLSLGTAGFFTGNVAVEAGTLELLDIGVIDASASLVLSAGASLAIAFNGEQHLHALVYNGQPVTPGTYEAGDLSFITGGGSGTLTIASIPEPSTYAIVGAIALLGLAVRRRRR